MGESAERWKLSSPELGPKSEGTEHLHRASTCVCFLEPERWSDEGTEENFLQVTQKRLQCMGVKEVIWTNPKTYRKLVTLTLKSAVDCIPISQRHKARHTVKQDTITFAFFAAPRILNVTPVEHGLPEQ